MSEKRQKLGKFGEQAALDYLQNLGMKLFEKNFRIRAGEIDLIMWDKDVLVFVEVRTRSNDAFGLPVETIDRTKRGKIVKTARHFLAKRKISPEIRCRFDLVGILTLPGKPPKINHIANAFFVNE
jgi:putative endonuclease